MNPESARSAVPVLLAALAYAVIGLVVLALGWALWWAMAVWARVPLFARAIRGTHLSSPHVSCHRDRHFQLRFETPPMFETDGELQQAATCDVSVSVRAGALTVIA